MTELEKLMKQKREIERRIREIKNQSVKYGLAKLDKQHYVTAKENEWYIAIDRIIDCPATAGRDKRYSIIRSTDRNKCIGFIDDVIRDLSRLRDKLKGEI